MQEEQETSPNALLAEPDVVLHVQLPWAALHAVGTRLPPVLVHHAGDGVAGKPMLARARIAACSDGRDNDGDRLVDMADPACVGGSHSDDEAIDNTAGSALTWSWGRDYESWVKKQWDFMQVHMLPTHPQLHGP